MAQQLGKVLNPEQLLSSAAAALDEGLLQVAEDICSEILAKSPTSVRALYIRGQSSLRRGKNRAALRDSEKAARLAPQDAAVALLLCRALMAEGLLQEVDKVLERSLPHLQGHGNLLRDFAELLIARGRYRQAVALLDRDLLQNPREAISFNMRGFALQQLGDHQGAIGNFTRALLLRPNFCHAANNRGNSLHSSGRFSEALTDYDLVNSIDPSYFHGWANRSKTLDRLGRREEALQSIERAIAINPRAASALITKADLLLGGARYQEALDLMMLACSVDPTLPEAWYGRGYSLAMSGFFDEAIAAYDRAIALRAPYPEALWNRALLRLASGDFTRGWQDFEWRWQCGLGRKPYLPGVPEWQGQSLEGQSLAVIGEQGMGDIIQFARFLPSLLNTASRVVLVAPVVLHQLLSTIDPRLELATPGDPIAPVDHQLMLMSIPARLHIGTDELPRSVPYLSTQKDLAEVWRDRIGAEGMKVGIVWQGNPAHPHEPARSIALSMLAPLSEIPGVRLISLQQRHGLEQIEDLPPRMTVEVFPELDDGANAFINTAAAMASLDLVITVDTAAAHLAGALGVPAWVLLTRAADWRWMREGSVSPWYPQTRLFRQLEPSDWAEVVAEVANALRLVTGRQRA